MSKAYYSLNKAKTDLVTFENLCQDNPIHFYMNVKISYNYFQW